MPREAKLWRNPVITFMSIAGTAVTAGAGEPAGVPCPLAGTTVMRCTVGWLGKLPPLPGELQAHAVLRRSASSLRSIAVCSQGAPAGAPQAWMLSAPSIWNEYVPWAVN